MSARPKLLDLFCGGGGAAMGYYRAGFDVTGIDNRPQKRYPFRFYQADALCYAVLHGREYDVIHASPPCQAYTTLRALHPEKQSPDLVAITRTVLQWLGKPYVIENVPTAPLKNPLLLCGTMFGLRTIRHRLFECNPPLYFPPASCSHTLRATKCGRTPAGGYITVAGHFSDIAYARQAMGIDWLSAKELSQAIPPAYTKYIGKQIRIILGI